MARRGNANVNSLLRSVQSARDSQLAYNDQAAAYNWDISAKTDADLAEYENYLKKRQGETADPSKALTIQSKITSARRTFTSSEIGRQTIAVLRGEGDNTGKLNRIGQLLDQAAANGDASLVQQLDESYSRLTKTIQEEQQAGSDKAAASARKAATQAITTAKNSNAIALQTLKGAFDTGQPLTGPDGQPIKVKYQNGAPVLDASGNIQPDPNGQPLRLDARTYASLQGHLLKVQENILQQDIQNNGDETGSKMESLLKLQNSGDYQKYATDAVRQRYFNSAGGDNPFVTKVSERMGPDGKPILSRDIADAPLTERQVIDPKTGAMSTQLVPVEGRTDSTGNNGGGDSYILNARVGSSPNDPFDRTMSKLRTVGIKPQDTQQLSSAAGGGQFSGYGDQKVITNPNQNALPSGKPRSDVLYVAGNGTDAIHSVAPLKEIGKDANGQPMYGTTTPADFASHDGGAAQYINDWQTGAKMIAGTGADALPKVASSLPVVGPAISAVGNLLGFGVKKRADAAKAAEEAARVKSAQDAANRAAIAQATAAATAGTKPATPSYNFASGTVKGIPGAPAIPAAVIKASNTPGTSQFNQKYLPGASKPWWQL